MLVSTSALHLDAEGAGVPAPPRDPAHRAVREAPAAGVLEAGRRARARRARVVSLQQHRARQPALARPRPRLAPRTRVVRHALLGHAHALLGHGTRVTLGLDTRRTHPHGVTRGEPEVLPPAGARGAAAAGGEDEAGAAAGEAARHRVEAGGAAGGVAPAAPPALGGSGGRGLGAGLGGDTLALAAPAAGPAAGALQRGVRGPGVVLPPAVEVAAEVARLLLLRVEAVGPVAQPALDVRGEPGGGHGNYTPHSLLPPLPRQPVPGEGEVRHLRGAAVLETRRLAAGQEAVEVGAGAARPRDLPRAQCRRHDVAARRAAVARLAAVVPHAEAAITNHSSGHQPLCLGSYLCPISCAIT